MYKRQVVKLLFVQGCPCNCCLCKVVYEIVVYARLSMWLFVQGCPCDCARLSMQLFVQGCLLDCCLHEVVHVIVQRPCDCLCKVVYAIVCARCPYNCLRLSLQLFAQCCPCSRLHKVVHGLLVQGSCNCLFVHVTVAALRWCMLDQALVSLTAVTLTRDGTADQTYLEQRNWSLLTCRGE